MTTETITTARQIDELKVAGSFFAAGRLARSAGHERNYGCHFGFRSTRGHAIAEFNRGWDASLVPTDDEVRVYLEAWYQRNYAERHGLAIGRVHPSVEGPECVDTNVFVAFSDGTDEVHGWTLWIEGGKVYGEW